MTQAPHSAGGSLTPLQWGNIAPNQEGGATHMTQLNDDSLVRLVPWLKKSLLAGMGHEACQLQYCSNVMLHLPSFTKL